jgi:hypothetical protein
MERPSPVCLAALAAAVFLSGVGSAALAEGQQAGVGLNATVSTSLSNPTFGPDWRDHAFEIRKPARRGALNWAGRVERYSRFGL